MRLDQLIEVIGKAFTGENIDELKTHLANDCKYSSDNSNLTLAGSDAIIQQIKKINTNLEQAAKFSYEVINIENYLVNDLSLEIFDVEDGTYVAKKGLLLFRNSDKPVAVIIIMVDMETNSIKNIELSRKREYFNVNFFLEEVSICDSLDDLPSTVTAYHPYYGRRNEIQNIILDDNIYIWKEADRYSKEWLNNNGYIISESQIFEDCIGYNCKRNNYKYTVFMYAYGQKKGIHLNGEYCEKLLDYSFAKDTTVLVLGLNVKRYFNGVQIEYKVSNYEGRIDNYPELWQVGYLGDKPALIYYPRKEMIDLINKLMYAFNHNDADVYEYILSYDNPDSVFESYKSSGWYLNTGIPCALSVIRNEYGNMERGYVSFDNVVYSETPYIDGYGYFSFRVDNKTDKIVSIKSHDLNEDSKKFLDFFRTGGCESDDLYTFIPNVSEIEILPPVFSERFSFKIKFDNGEIRKYVLPIEREYENEEEVSYCKYNFTNDIWNSAKVVQGTDAFDQFMSHPLKRRQAILFDNGFQISVLKCYLDGKEYYEPVLHDSIVYEDENYKLCKKWSWKVNYLIEDKETGLYQGLITGHAFNGYGKSTFASSNGERLISLEFDYMDSFNEGLVLVGNCNRGYGFLNKDMKFVVPLKYENADSFNGGKAKVKYNNIWNYIDTSGNIIEKNPIANGKYKKVIQFSNGTYMVSTLELDQLDLAYHSEHSSAAGIWGFLNENGEEIVAPQYIYAYGFKDDLAIVCKGKWTIDKKWDNEYNQGKYWTEEELWGAIDTSGEEIIPCIYDDIQTFSDVDNVYKVHFGGWKEGKWGIINQNGNYLVEPIFLEIGYVYKDGLFTFIDDFDLNDTIYGIYDLNQQKVIFEPQFLDVNFLEDGYINVEIFDEKLGRTVERIIDINGKEKFPSIYSAIFTSEKPYEVWIEDDNGTRKGLIDENGEVVLPCKYRTAWGGIYFDKKLMIYEENDLQGIMDFEENVIIEPKYLEILGIDKPLLIVEGGERGGYGLITMGGFEVLPTIYERIVWVSNNRIICRQTGNCEVYELIEKKHIKKSSI